MALSLHLERQDGRLVVHNRLVPVARLVLGIPLTLAGFVTAYGVFTAVTAGVRAGGLDAAPSAALGAWLQGLLTVLLLPLGWWLTFGRRYLVIDPRGPSVAEVVDWRLWRQETQRPAALFRAVRVAAEPLNDEPSDSGPAVYCQQIRLLARDPRRQASFEIGVLDLDARPEAITAAGQVAGALGLPLEVAAPDARLRSPEREIDDAGDDRDLDDGLGPNAFADADGREDEPAAPGGPPASGPA